MPGHLYFTLHIYIFITSITCFPMRIILLHLINHLFFVFLIPDDKEYNE